MRWPIAVFASLVVGFVAGWLLHGATSAVGDVPPSAGAASSAGATEPTPTLATSPRPQARPSSGDELAHARQEATYWHAMYDEMAVEAYGEPIPFADDLPEEATEAGFRRLLDEVVAECAPGAAVPIVDCSEYPCRAVIRDVDKQLFGTFADCPPWAAYAGAVTASLDMDCDDGRKEGVIELIMERGHGPVTSDDEGRNAMKRSMARTDQIAESWTCAPPP